MKEKLLSFYNQYKVIIFPVLVSASSLIIIILVIYPTLLILLSQNQRLNNIQKTSNALNIKAQELSSINESELNKNLSISLNALPIDKEFSGALSVIQSLASTLGFNISSIQISPGVPKNINATGFSLKIEIIGPRLTLNSFLTGLENSPRAMKITSIEVNPSKTGEAVNAVINVVAFYKDPPSSLGVIDAPLPKLSDSDQEIIATLARASSVSNVPKGESVPKGKNNPFE